MSAHPTLNCKRAWREDILLFAVPVALATVLLIALPFELRLHVSVSTVVASLLGAALLLVFCRVAIAAAVSATSAGLEVRENPGRIKRIPWNEIERIELWRCPALLNRTVDRIMIVGAGAKPNCYSELATISETLVQEPIDQVHAQLVAFWMARR